ncbi:hypothetical protein JCM10450v2_000802 [Rhodotorula kratochvilovae]
MGLFGNKHAQENVPPAGTTVTTTTSTPHGGGPGLFGKRKSISHPAPAPVEPATTNKSGGLLSRKRRSSEDLPSGYRFSKHDTLHGARTKLEAAQQAESAADAALIRARAAVKEARAEILALEREAEAEAKAAKEKQKMAKSYRVAGDKLGRHM